MKSGMNISAKSPAEVAKALEQVGASVLFANKNLGCALAFVNNGKGVERKTHQFTTSNPITPKGALTRTARKELAAAGILAPPATGSFSSTKRLVARGALAAAFSGALLLSGGANNAMANNIGFTYLGGTNPLGEVIVDCAKPAFVDIDGDGDLDCFVGAGYGYIEFWKNTGTATSPNFTLITGDANPLTGTQYTYLASPTFVDIDGDGDMDCFVGHSYGLYQDFRSKEPGPESLVSFFENTGSKTNPVFDVTNVYNPRKTIDYNPLIANDEDLSEASPTFADVDGDGDMDAFVGGFYGYIYAYENLTINDELRKTTITGTIEFDSWGPMFYYQSAEDTEPYDDIWAEGGCAVPFFWDVDGDGDLDLFVGNKYGAIQYYENTGDKFNMHLVERDMADSPFRGNPGMYSAPAAADINGDGMGDLFVGTDPFDYFDDRKVKDNPFPTDFYSNIYVRYYQNVGTKTEPDLRSRGDNPFNLGPAAFYPALSLADMDGDGDLDAIVGCMTSYYEDSATTRKSETKSSWYTPRNLRYYENTGNAENPLFAQHFGDHDPWAGQWWLDWYLPAPGVADLDGDGVNEVYVGFNYYGGLGKIASKDTITPTGRIEAFTYITDTMRFDQLCDNPLEKLDQIPIFPQPSFVDIDGDGDLDAFLAGVSEDGFDIYNANILFYRNVGTAITPTFSLITDTNPLTGISGVFVPNLSFSDVDGDGDSDMVLSDRYPWYYIFLMGGTKDKKEDLDFEVGTRYFENIGSVTEPVFKEQIGENNPLANVLDKTLPGATAMADMDNDKDPDALLGDMYGKIYYYRNIGSLEEAANVLKDSDDLCFIESAKSDSSLWDRIADSCKQGAHKIRSFFSPS